MENYKKVVATFQLQHLTQSRKWNEGEFWNEHWVGDDSLGVLFPHLYTLSLQRNSYVAQVWSLQGWNLLCRRVLNDWEVDEISRLL